MTLYRIAGDLDSVYILSDLFSRHSSELMRAHRVSKRVNKPENDDPELLTLV